MRNGQRLLIGVLALVPAILSTGDLPATDWTGLAAARRLREEGRHDEAVKRFEAMAARAPTDLEQFRYLEQAIDIAAGPLGDFERARGLARSVRDPARRDYAEFDVLWRFRKEDEALAAARDKPIDTWPADCRGSACRILGDLCRARKDDAAALAHYTKAAHAAGAPAAVRGGAARQAGRILLERGDRAGAEGVFRHALGLSPAAYAWRCECLLTLAEMLAEERRAAEAVKLFEEIDFGKLEAGPWKSKLLEGYARALLAAGRRIKAVETFDLLLRSGISKSWQARIEKELDKLADEW